jgi:hypothetical protein
MAKGFQVHFSIIYFGKLRNSLLQINYFSTLRLSVNISIRFGMPGES